MGNIYQHPETYKAAVQLAQALLDISKNPKIITEAVAESLKASQMSEDRLNEVKAAETSLEQNKLISERLSQDKAYHKSYVEASHRELDQKHAEVEQGKEDLARVKKLFQQEVTDVTEKISKREKEANDRHTSLDVRTADIIQREQTCHEVLASVTKREKLAEAREARLKDDLDKLAAKKKKLAEAAKDD